jgi:ArsR family transcriptional regulator
MELAKKLQEIGARIDKSARTHNILADSTRLKILYLLSRQKELCPSDISGALKISISAVSHQLKLLNNFDLVARLKMGRMVCYTITKKGRKILSLTNNK